MVDTLGALEQLLEQDTHTSSVMISRRLAEMILRDHDFMNSNLAEQGLRTEALRAAAETMHGAVEVQGIDKIAIINETKDIAVQFATWLKTGEE